MIRTNLAGATTGAKDRKKPGGWSNQSFFKSKKVLYLRLSFKFIARSINYPPAARKNRIQGGVIVSFFIEKDGRITDPTILRDVGGGCGQEALRLVSTMPNWEPGIKNGQPVRVEYVLPVRFKLE